MNKLFIVVVLGLALIFPAANTYALSCVTLDMYLEGVVNDDTTLIYVGTATEVKNHTQVVTVTEALKGWVAPKVWVNHPYSTDWKYYCSNGPAPKGEPTIFFMTVDQYGSFSVVQTLDPDSSEGKAFLADIKKANVDAGITEAKAEERASELMDSVSNLIKALLNMLTELRYWQQEVR